MKKTRKQRKEEERKILAELDEAVAAERLEAPAEETAEEKIHCRRCKTLMKNGVCPTCGYKIYIGMSEEKRKKIRGIVTVVCLAVFAVAFLLLQFK